jgi:NADH:ubiquinone oxidoreductase subunit 6 (subunit J)
MIMISMMMMMIIMISMMMVLESNSFDDGHSSTSKPVLITVIPPHLFAPYTVPLTTTSVAVRAP